MQRLQLECLEETIRHWRYFAQSLPFSASALPPQKRDRNVPIRYNRKCLIFSNLGRVSCRIQAEGCFPILPVRLCDDARSKRHAKGGGCAGPKIQVSAIHSYRKISTGRSRDAALAGSTVAPTEIAMATIVIQTPSQMLG